MTARYARLLYGALQASGAGGVVEVVPYDGRVHGPADADGADAGGDYWCRATDGGIACIGKPGVTFEWVPAP